jgi:hypothetical protein
MGESAMSVYGTISVSPFVQYFAMYPVAASRSVQGEGYVFAHQAKDMVGLYWFIMG